MNKIVINIGTGTGAGKTTLSLLLKNFLEEFGATVKIEDDNEDSPEVIEKLTTDMDAIMSNIAPNMDIVIRTTQLNRSGISHSDIHSYNHPEGYKVRPQGKP